ncbi:hypothetical protein QCA50_001264 [Cerrena zonata]|uniref:Bola-like protein n=1 Tax=Cerrena zonata TaxID=2478898 RepID=A0AAW0GSS7_9APHY
MPLLSQSLRQSLRTSRAAFAIRTYAASANAALDTGEQSIYNKLAEKFSPTELRVQDVSGGCGSFYAISITSEAFKGLNTIKQHRLVNETLKKEIEGIHGLQLKTSVPEK